MCKLLRVHMHLNIMYKCIPLYTTELSMIIDRSGKKSRKYICKGWQIDFDGLRRREDFYGDWCFLRIIKKSKWVLSFKDQ